MVIYSSTPHHPQEFPIMHIANSDHFIPNHMNLVDDVWHISHTPTLHSYLALILKPQVLLLEHILLSMCWCSIMAACTAFFMCF